MKAAALKVRPAFLVNSISLDKEKRGPGLSPGEFIGTSSDILSTRLTMPVHIALQHQG